jgi:hypothetical protein
MPDDQINQSTGDGGTPASTGGTGQASTGTPASTGSVVASTGTVTSSASSTGGVAFSWPEGWRERYSAGADGKVDEKKLNRLARYESPSSVIDALMSVQNRISAGELRSVLPKDATPEQVKQYRAENGIPETPEGYQPKLKDGLVIGEEDKPFISEFFKAAHAANLGNGAVGQIIDWYYDTQEAQMQAQAEADKKVAQTSADTLNAEWGTEYRTNMNLIDGILASAPAAFVDLFKHGRLSDQTPIFASVDGMRWLAQLARQINPVAAVVPNASGNIAQAVDDELKQIKAWMSAPDGSPEHKKYWGDEKMQARYRELLDAQSRAKPAK